MTKKLKNFIDGEWVDSETTKFTNVLNPRAHVSRKHDYRPTLVKKGVSIGANATILCGHALGRYAFIGAGSVVTKDIPDHALVYGNPAIIQGWVCKCGIKLQGEGIITCTECGKQYKVDKECCTAMKLEIHENSPG